MKGKSFFVYAILMGLLAAVVTLITWQMDGLLVKAGTPLTYITFCSWATYFMIGANVKDGILGVCSAVAGIVAAILMFILAINFGFTPWWAVPLAVFIMVPFMIYCEKVKPIRNVSAVFIGTGLYFSLSAAGAFNDLGFTAKGYVFVAIAELIYMVIGFIAGWASIRINSFSAGLFCGKETEQ